MSTFDPREYDRIPKLINFLVLLAWLFLFGFIAGKTYGAEPLQSTNYTLEKGFDTSGVENPSDMHETDWSAWLATQMRLDPREVCEVRTFDKSRVDILTDDEAIEVEWSKKWKESIGQSLLYSIETNREPGVILLSRGDDLKYILRCQIVCNHVGIKMRVQRVPPKTTNGIDP